MKDNKTTRRRLLKGAAYGSPLVWTSPVITSVVLPVHAQTTGARVEMNSTGGVTAFVPDMRGASELLELFMSSAHAGAGDLIGSCVKLVVEGSVATATLTLNTGESASKAGTISGKAITIANINRGYEITGALNSASNPSSAALKITGFNEVGSITVNTTGPECVVSSPTTTGAPTTTPAPTYSIGDTGPCGGVVYEVSNDGLNGKEAAPADLPGTYSWEDAKTAASNYMGGGCSGWYLPNQEELNVLYGQKNIVGNFANDGYWTSTEESNDFGWYQYFGNGDQPRATKDFPYRARAVRAF